MILTKEQFETQWAENTLTTTDWFDTTWALFKELEEAMKPKTCGGCKFNYTTHKSIKTCQSKLMCSREYKDRYEPKDNA